MTFTLALNKVKTTHLCLMQCSGAGAQIILHVPNWSGKHHKAQQTGLIWGVTGEGDAAFVRCKIVVSYLSTVACPSRELHVGFTWARTMLQSPNMHHHLQRDLELMENMFGRFHLSLEAPDRVHRFLPIPSFPYFKTPCPVSIPVSCSRFLQPWTCLLFMLDGKCRNMSNS